MKKTFILLLITFSIISISKAQFFIGGGMNIYSTKHKDADFDKRNYSDFKITSHLGYQYNEKMSFGGIISYNRYKSKSYDFANRSERKSKYPLFGIGIFNRYNLLSFDRFNLLAKSEVALGFGTDKETNDAITKEGLSETAFKININPCLTYQLSNNIDIELDINFLSFGTIYTNTTSAPEKGTLQTTNKSSSFYWASMPDDWDDDYSFLTLGASYRF